MWDKIKKFRFKKHCVGNNSNEIYFKDCADSTIKIKEYKFNSEGTKTIEQYESIK